MRNILQIGFTTEGSTDLRFLGNIIQKTFETIALECRSEIEVYPPVYLKKEGVGFTNQIINLAKKFSYFHVICVHCDADSPSIENRMQHNIIPTITEINNIDGVLCKNLVAVIPVQMTEAWMMADFELLKEKMSTVKSNNELQLPIRTNLIENLANPKESIINALKIAQISQPRRRNKLTISNLYSPISQELTIEKLRNLHSFKIFEENVRNAMKQINYL